MADRQGPLEAEMGEARDVAALPCGEQLELIRDQVPGRDAGTAVIVSRGRGRPPGAMNRRNAKFRDQILALGPHPAIALQRAYSRPVEVLAAELDCSKLEAFQIQVRAAAELLPYIEGKQPVQVQLTAQHDMVMVIGGPPGATVDGGELAALRDEIEEAGEALDWGSVTFEEVAETLPRLGEPQRGAPSGTGD